MSDIGEGEWRPPVVKTIASDGTGVEDLWKTILRHREHMESSGDLQTRRKFRLAEELREIVARRLYNRAREICTGPRWDELQSQVLDRRVDPWTAADEMLASVQA